MGEVKLTKSQASVLTELRRRHLNGGLTGRIAEAIWGIRAKSDRVRRPCIKMEEAGLVRRHQANCEWWYITPAGRAAIASMETVEGGGEHG